MDFRHPPLVRFRTCFDALSGAYRIPLHLIYTVYISLDFQYMSLASLFQTTKLLLFSYICKVHFGPFCVGIVSTRL